MVPLPEFGPGTFIRFLSAPNSQGLNCLLPGVALRPCYEPAHREAANTNAAAAKRLRRNIGLMNLRFMIFLELLRRIEFLYQLLKPRIAAKRIERGVVFDRKEPIISVRRRIV